MSTPISLDSFMTYTPTPPGTGRIRVRGDQVADAPVTERLFGLFTEHWGKTSTAERGLKSWQTGGLNRLTSSWRMCRSTSVLTCWGRPTGAWKSPRASFACRIYPASVSWACSLLGARARRRRTGAAYELVEGLNGKAQRIRVP